MPTVSNFDCRSRVIGLVLVALLVSVPALAQDPWVQFVDDTASRLSASPSLVASDVREKDYAWGDVDNDGDTDLVIVRKQPFTSAGKFPNVLSPQPVRRAWSIAPSDFASASDVPRRPGFPDPDQRPRRTSWST